MSQWEDFATKKWEVVEKILKIGDVGFGLDCVEYEPQPELSKRLVVFLESSL